jgi:release factor glutamine methyltransferase
VLDVVTTVGDLVEQGVAALAAAGVADAAREGRELFAACVCGTASDAWLRRAEPAPAALRQRFETAIDRRARGWPQAYAAGRACFRGHWLAVDDRVLIPRPETEGLVELVVRWAQRQCATTGAAPLVTDVGTGSGCIAISLALEAQVAGVIASDVSADALNLALENAAAAGVKERVGFRRGDLLLPLLDDRVDAVVSNPPYIATAEWEQLEPSVRDREPRLALDGGPDGLEPTRRLLGAARAALRPGGLLALEIDARRAAASAALARDAGFEGIEVGEDLFGRPRYLTGRQPGAA